MKILFSMRHAGALRNFASTVAELARRGHEVHLVFMMRDKLRDARLVSDLTAAWPGVTSSEIGKRTPWRAWQPLAKTVRSAADYLRYLAPEFAAARPLRRRALSEVPPGVRGLLERPIVRSAAGRRMAARLLRAVERAIPTDPWIVELLERERPDAVLVTPLVEIGSDQVEYLRAARALGIPTGLCVHSWDNLTNKGLIRGEPDRVFVWNAAQTREAVAMHGIAPGAVIATGAPVYDQWFERAPSTTREAFCRKVGLPAERPFVLYLCSSQFVAFGEAAFVEQWIRAIRSAPDPRVREAGILIRPHPRASFRPWQDLDLGGAAGVTIWPPGGANPVDEESKNDYFDSMYHAAAAVGINTSAQIEAGIVGRPVYSIRVPDEVGTQDGTLHFRYLVTESGGLLHLAGSLDEHVRALAAAFEDPDRTADRLRRFVEGFVRPHGLHTPATPLLAGAIEQLARMPKRAPQARPAAERLLQAALYPVARSMKPVLPAGASQTVPAAREGLRSRIAALPASLFQWEPAKRYARRHIVPRVVPPQAEAARRETVAVLKVVQAIAKSGRPVIAGPWLGDPGTELLYWMPFLAWARAYRSIPADRLVVVSHGGAASWYQHVGARYLDALDFYTPEQFLDRNRRRLRESKNYRRAVITDFDREVLAHVHAQLGTSDTDLLHPSTMYRLFSRYWSGQAPIGLVERFTSHERLPAPAAGGLSADLPPEYVAVRFDFSDAFPETSDNRAFVDRVLDDLLDAHEVVLLDVPGSAHAARIPPARRSRLHRIGHLTSPRTELDVQARVIGGARAFAGSFGRVSHLAPFFGVPAVAFYSERSRSAAPHLDLARHAFGRLEAGLHVVSTHDVAALGLALGRHGALAAMLHPAAVREGGVRG